MDSVGVLRWCDIFLKGDSGDEHVQYFAMTDRNNRKVFNLTGER
jgi:hypothetical protein